MNALRQMDPAEIGRIMRDGRAHERAAGARIGRDLVNGPARHTHIGPEPRRLFRAPSLPATGAGWAEIIAKAVIVAGLIVSTIACVTQ